MFGLGPEHEVELGRGVVKIALLDVQQAYLGARVRGIGLDLLGFFQLVERLGVFLLAGQDFRLALANQLVVRIDLRDLVVIDQRVLRTLLPLAQQREIKQHQLRLRIEVERLLIIFFGRRVILRRHHHLAGVVVAKERIGIERDQLLESFLGLAVIAALGVERAEIQIGFLVLGIETQYLAIILFRGVVVAERRADTRAEQPRVRRIGIDRERLVHLLERLLQPPVADVERRQPDLQRGVAGIVLDRLRVILERLFAVAVIHRDLGLQERAHRARIRRHVHRRRAAEGIIPADAGAADILGLRIGDSGD